MPRPNKERTIGVEEAFARHIEAERQRRGWTLEDLADEMALRGCPLHPTAIHKTIQGAPRRRIVLDEAVAYSRVFHIPLERMLS